MRFNVVDLLMAPTGEMREVDVDDTLDLSADGVRLAGPVRGSVRLMRGPVGVFADGSLRVPVHGECVRCLEPIVVDVEFELEEEYRPTLELPGGPAVGKDHEDGDAATLIDELHVLDLTEVLRQDILLAVPLHTLCRTDCGGLCPTCGAVLSQGRCDCRSEPDPRWAALRALLDEAE